MKIRFMRNFEGILKAQAEGYCWVDLVLWMRNERYLWENVDKARQCGYCGGCLQH